MPKYLCDSQTVRKKLCLLVKNNKMNAFVNVVIGTRTLKLENHDQNPQKQAFTQRFYDIKTKPTTGQHSFWQ